MSYIRSIVLVALVSALIGCAPRGESKTLSEVVSVAKERFATVQDVALPTEIEELLEPAVHSLEDLLNNPRGGGVTKNAKVLADSLSALIPHASYTNRPGMSELLSQFLEVSNRPASEVSSGTMKLLAARTYNSLASELETRKFSL